MPLLPSKKKKEKEYIWHHNLLWAEKGCVATLFLQSYNHLSTFKSGKLHTHLKHEIYAWLQSLHLTQRYISLPRRYMHTQHFSSKSYAKLLYRRTSCISSFYLVTPSEIAAAGFTKRNNDYKKETKIKAASSCKSDGITYKHRKSA